MFIEMPHLSQKDYAHQGKALYKVILREDVFPKSFTLARNAIKAKSNTQRGDLALYSIIASVHPSITDFDPPSMSPPFDTCDDIYDYEKQLRAYFLLWMIKRTKYPRYTQAMTFTKGIAHTEFQQAATRILQQLDNFKDNKNNLPEIYNLDNIVLTVRDHHSMKETKKSSK